MANAILLISCPDSKGITAAVTGFVARHGGNIIHADQHIDEQSLTFFMRIEWSLEGFDIPREKIAERFAAIADQFSMSLRLHFSDQKIRLAVFVGKPLHCLYDLLYRYRAGHLKCDVPLVISNHPDGRQLAADFKIVYEEFVVLKENKAAQEQKQLALLRRHKVDAVVLARYHQILTPAFIEEYKNRVINIHHSFLPAFAGSNPYGRAYQKGVKLIGATSHYVNEELDEGPIIEQDTVRVSHRDSLRDMIRKGEDLEKMVLARAVRWHLEHKVLCYGHKTVIFD